MPEPDFESIIRKYRSLISDRPSSDDKNMENAQGGKVAAKSSPDQSSPAQPTASGKVFSNADVSDNYLSQDRFVRAPLALPQQQAKDEAYEHVIFNSLFATVDQNDAFSPSSFVNRERFFKENELELDGLAAELARRLYQHEMDLRQQYDPSLGMYPTQALYVPQPTKLRWKGAPSEKHVKKEMDPSKKPATAKPTSEKGGAHHPKESHPLIHRKSEMEGSDEDKEGHASDYEEPEEREEVDSGYQEVKEEQEPSK